MKEIPLTQNKVALVDDEDFEMLSQKKWTALKSRGGWRATHYYREGAQVKAIAMHRLIMGNPDGLEVDHRDGNGLNNQRKNLRTATHAQNMQNRRMRKQTISKVKGVRIADDRQRKYRAVIMCNGQIYQLGGFYTLKEAADAYDRAAVKYHGEFASLNNYQESA